MLLDSLSVFVVFCEPLSIVPFGLGVPIVLFYCFMFVFLFFKVLMVVFFAISHFAPLYLRVLSIYRLSKNKNV